MFDEKLIIKQFLENQKISLLNNLNAANITQVFKSLGFYLNEFDIASTGGNQEDNTLSIEIKCAHSGILSKLYLPNHDCHCGGINPPKHKAYWEMHGSQPNSPSCSNLSGGSTFIHEAATNLLPEADHTWKILAKNMFDFILRMQNDIAKYKDEQNNMEYDDPVAVESAETNDKTETGLNINQEVSPVYLQSYQNSPYSTPLSSINVTPIVVNEPNMISAPIDNGAQSLINSTSSSCQEESTVIALVMEAKSKLDQALLFMKFKTGDVFFDISEPLKSTPAKMPESKSSKNFLQVNKSLLRRRSTNTSISSNSTLKTEVPSNKTASKVTGRLSMGSVDIRNTSIEKKNKSPMKKPTKLFIVPQTRTSALRIQKLKN